MFIHIKQNIYSIQYRKMFIIKVQIIVIGPGKWSAWSSYGACSAKCGKGIETRTRTCIREHGATACIGSAVDTRVCDSKIKCVVVNGNWGKWSSYGPCSRTCKGGYRTRHRSCDYPKPSNGGKYCEGDGYESVSCGGDVACPVYGTWGQWSSYGECSKSCGYGNKKRTRVCNREKGEEDCKGRSVSQTSCFLGECPCK